MCIESHAQHIEDTEKLYIVYKVDLGRGLLCKPWIQIHKINLQQRNISLFQVQVLWEWVINIMIGITIRLTCLFNIFGTCTASREFGVANICLTII